MSSTSIRRMQNLSQQLNPNKEEEKIKIHKVPDLSSHVLDTSIGRPAKDVIVYLEKKIQNKFILFAKGKTNNDGRITIDKWISTQTGESLQVMEKSEAQSIGTYRITFEVEEYFKQHNKETLYPIVQIIFNMDERQHYHIPLLLSPYGFTTYRGS